MEETQAPETTQRRQNKGQASFCIPACVADGLVAGRVNVAVICAYLLLARSTDATGRFSSASKSALKKHLGVNMDRAERILAELCQLRITPTGKGAKPERIVWSREDYEVAHPGEAIPDGPVEHSRIRYVLPDFGEDLGRRVWFSSAIAEGIGSFPRPLVELKNAGDMAAHVLLLVHRWFDPQTWIGIPPSDTQPSIWRCYEPVGDVAEHGDARIYRASRWTEVSNLMREVGTGQNERSFWDAFKLLESAGFFYEVVMAINRDPHYSEWAHGDQLARPAPDAEPLYQLDARSLHGYKSPGESGLAGLTAKTAGELGFPVTEGKIIESEDAAYADALTARERGQFDGTYAAIVPRGQGVHIVGVFRPRFRSANAKNANVSEGWRLMQEADARALKFLLAYRKRCGLPEIVKADPEAQPTKPSAKAPADLSTVPF